jgi:hypothetical protein
VHGRAAKPQRTLVFSNAAYTVRVYYCLHAPLLRTCPCQPRFPFCWSGEPCMKIGETRVGPERRLAVRHPVRTRLRIRIRNSETPEQRAESVNISDHGMYLLCRTPFVKGEQIEVLLKMPEELTGEPEREWRCSGKVVRVDRNGLRDGRVGVGVEFHRCERLPREPRMTIEDACMNPSLEIACEATEMAGHK